MSKLGDAASAGGFAAMMAGGIPGMVAGGLGSIGGSILSSFGRSKISAKQSAMEDARDAANAAYSKAANKTMELQDQQGSFLNASGNGIASQQGKTYRIQKASLSDLKQIGE